MKRAVLLAGVAALVAAVGAAAAAANFAAYRAQVNGICRSYTPKFKRLEADMVRAKRAGDARRYAYDFGTILGLGLAQGVRVEKTPVPADGRARMAPTLRLLHASDSQLRRTIQAATSGDPNSFKTQLVKLAKVSAPLNRSFDSVGLQDCGSRQT
jgi:NaMN:DMB phosphoribosyltransferase